jgi:hypothetical protein
MPNRIIRDGILSSEPVNALSWPAELFYRRLFSVVDDYGRYSAHPGILRAALYPLQLEKVSESDIGKWLRETEKAALVRLYSLEQKRYLEVAKFGQQVRARSKCPDPPWVENEHPPPTDINRYHLLRASNTTAPSDSSNGNSAGARSGSSRVKSMLKEVLK